MRRRPDTPPGRAMPDLSRILRFLPKITSRQSLAWRYGGAVLISLAFIALRWLVGRVIDDGAPFALLFIPIALSGFYGGFGPGLVSILTTIAFADYFLILPLYTVGLPDTRAVVYTLFFSISGLIVSALGEVGRNAVLQASNEAEICKITQQQLLDLLTDLLGLPRITRHIRFRLAFGVGLLSEVIGHLIRLKRPPYITRYGVSLVGRSTGFSTAKARTQLGWKPQVNVQDGMRDTLEWFQNAAGGLAADAKPQAAS